MDITGDREKIRELLDLANARVSECRKLQLNSLPNRMISRFAYLALLYAALAMLESRGLAGDFDIDAGEVQHERMISQFQQVFVKTELVSTDFSAALYRTFDIWVDNDRNPVTSVTEADAVHFVKLSEELIAIAEKNLI